MAKKAVVLVFLLGLILRLNKASTLNLSGDMVKNWRIAGEIVAGGNFPLVGPQASIDPNIKMGPAYYYLLAILHKISFGNYKTALIIFAIINSLSILLFYKVVKKFFNEKIALISSFLFAISKYAIEFGSLPWNSFFIPLFIILTFYALTIEKTFWQCLLFGLSTGILFQLHQSAWLVLPVFVYAFVHNVIPSGGRHFGCSRGIPLVGRLSAKKGIPPRVRPRSVGDSLGRNDKMQGLVALLMFLLVNIPYILSELNRGGTTIKAIANIFNIRTLNQNKFGSGQAIKQFNNCDFSYWLANHGHGEKCFQWIRNPLFILRFFSHSLLGTTNIWALPFIALMLSYFIFKVKTPYKKFLLLWLFLPLPVLLIYNSSIFLHYLLMYFPLPYIIVGLLLEHIIGKGSNYWDNHFATKDLTTQYKLVKFLVRSFK